MHPFTTVTDLTAQIRSGDVSPVDAVETYLDRIDRLNDDYNAYVTVLDEEARSAARAAERAVEAGEDLPPLHGVPVAIKDLYAYKEGVRNTYGSVPFADNVSEADALVVERLEAAGAIVLGKTNTPEFGFMGLTNNGLFGPTSTPFDPDGDRNSGGSSGGSAAATAAGLAPFAQASDGGGSVRIPASCCGIYGIKPSFGRIPYEGRPDAFSAHTPFGNAGPVSRTVEDAALMLDAVCGPHPRDPLSVPDDGIDFVGATERSTDGFSVAYSPDLDIFTVDDRVAETVRDAVDAFEDAGATVEEVEVDFGYDADRIIEEWMTVSRVKYAAMAERLRDAGVDLQGEHREDVTPELLEIIEAGPEVSGIEYKRTDEVRTTIFDAIQDVFDDYDLLVSPTLATLPPGHDGVGPDEVNGEPIDPLLGWFLTWPFNLTGHPAASVPAGLVDGLPVGMQVVGRRFADDDVLAASAAFERVRPWHDWYERFE